jgi:SAM-dependent methyltransferase
MRAADLGCGVGMVTGLIADLVGPRGHVVGIDTSAAQLAQARAQLHPPGINISFFEASATETGLPRESFDLVEAAGFPAPEATSHQPVRSRGRTKRFLELSVAEAGPAFVAAGLITAAELERTLAEIKRLADDETVLAVMPRMTQVWARKSVLPTRGRHAAESSPDWSVPADENEFPDVHPLPDLVP